MKEKKVNNHSEKVNKLELKIKSENKEINILVHPHLNIHELLEEISNLLIAYGYHPETVRAGFLGMAENYEDDNEER